MLVGLYLLRFAIGAANLTQGRERCFTGYHEVVCTSATVAALRARLADPTTADRPQIRISSTFFHHLSSDETLSPRKFAEQTSDSGVVQVQVQRLQDRGETWDLGVYEEGMKVGTLVQVRFKIAASTRTASF